MKPIELPVCVVDDDPSVRADIANLLQAEGLRVETFSSPHEFLSRKSAAPPACLVLDFDLPKFTALELQGELTRAEQDIPIIFLTTRGTITMTVRAIKEGSIDFLTRPFDSGDLVGAIRESLALRESAVNAPVPRVSALDCDIIGMSAGLQAVLKRVSVVAPTASTVLILGETGVGKELIAERIHQCSHRKNGPLIRVNCASIPKDLFESEFFGHVKGAFTGATKDRAGRFEVAHGGTLFLDEVGEIPLEHQSKLLRALQEKQYERVGDDNTRHVDVRIIAATNRDLQCEVDAGRFRRDFYYRLNIFPVNVPSLRDRLEDIPILAEHFVNLATKELGCRRPRLTEAAMAKLQTYDWPGNIRELRTVVERAVILACGDALDFVIPTSHTPSNTTPAIFNGKGAEIEYITELEWSRRERENLLAALNRSNWKIGGPNGAAELLGVKPTTLASRMKKMGLKRGYEPMCQE